jgi:hypothetical protein
LVRGRSTVQSCAAAPSFGLNHKKRCTRSSRGQGERRHDNGALAKALASDKVRDQIIKVGALPKSLTPEELRKHVQAELARWREVRDKAGIEPQQ